MNTSKNRLIAEYALRKLPKGKELMLRKGYYQILKFNKVWEVNDRLHIIALANWSDEPTFEQSFIVQVQLQSLYNSDSEGATSIYPMELINSILHIISIEILEKEFEGKPYHPYKVCWDLKGFIEKPTFIDTPIETNSEETNPVPVEQDYDDYLTEELEIIVAEEYHNRLLLLKTEQEWFEEEALMNNEEVLNGDSEAQQLKVDECLRNIQKETEEADF